MKHYFDVLVAKECGVNAAVIYENIKYWVTHNKKQGKNEREGRYWMYQTQKELSEQFEYLTVKQVRTALAKLVEAGFIIKGNFNRHGYDRTVWYSVADDAAHIIEEEKPKQEEVAEVIELKEVSAVKDKEENHTKEATEKPRKAPAKGGGSKYPYGRKQKPKWAHPVPDWLNGNSRSGATIQDIKEDSKKESLIKRMRELAAECGAVCTV